MGERKLRRGIEEQIKATLKVRQSISYLVVLKELDVENILKNMIRCASVDQFRPVLFQKYTRMKTVDPTYANFVDVPIPLKDEEEAEPCDQKVCSSWVWLQRPLSNSFLLTV